MRIGLLGDVHGNALALAAVLDAARDSGIDKLCLTGDFVGYYYEPGRVIEMLSDWDCHAVRGNHEDMFLECVTDESAIEQCRQRYGSGIEFAIQGLSPEQVDYIRGLPSTLTVELDGKSLLLAHGAPWDTDFYVYPDSSQDLWERVVEGGTDYVVLGHTHYQLAKRIGNTLVVNPGSVGQPRDRKPGAAWAILETETGSLEHRTESYDIQCVAKQAQSIDPQWPYLWKVLTRR